MSSLLPRQIDPNRLAEKGEILQGDIAAAEFDRLGDAAVLLDTHIPVSLEFEREIGGRSTISGSVSTEVELICQRCMAPMSVKLETEFKLVVVSSEEDAMHLPEEFDPVICGKDERLDLNAFVEDELLLALPIVVFHEHEQDCGVSSTDLASAKDQPDEENSSSSPFAILKKLKEDD